MLGGVTGATRHEAPTQAAGAPAPRADVELSAAARHLAALHDGGDDVQAERIQQIRDALAAGELHINPEKIADGLLASVRELLK